MPMTKEQIAALETPCLVVDVERARRNALAMQREADACGCALRPHVKTHKMPFFAHMQMEAGACGITCAKVSEAEVMAGAGLSDLFIAYPMVGDFRIRRALALLPKVKRLILAVDSLECAARLQEAAGREGVTLEVRLEADTGAARTGVLMENARKLAVAVAEMPNLRLTGIYTFKSLLYQRAFTPDSERAAREEGELMARLAEDIRAAGIPLRDISAGSTPTGIAVAKTGLVNEIRPGTYLFNDVMLVREGVCAPDAMAARLYATVVSCPAESYAVIDGGSKCFPADVPILTPPLNIPGYAVVEGREHLRFTRMNEEHGILTSETGRTGLRVGEVLTLLPIHVCTAVNLQNQVYLLENGILRREKVAARGMLA